MVLNGPRVGSEFVVMLVTIMKINVLKTIENVFNQHDFGVEEMKIVFCCCGCSSHRRPNLTLCY